MLREVRSREAVARGPAHPGGRGRRAQHLRADQRARAARREACEIARNGREALELRSSASRRPAATHRPGADGHHDAGDGRPHRDARDPQARRAGRSCRSSRSPPRRCPTTASECLRRRRRTTTSPSRSTSTSCSRWCASGCRSEWQASVASESEFDIELPLLLEAIYREYHYDFRALRDGLAASAGSPGAARASTARSLSALQETRAARARGLPRAARVPHRAGERDVPRPGVLPCAARAGRAASCGPTRRCKVWVAGCSTGEEVYSLAILLREEGLLERTLHLRHRHQPRGAAAGRGGHLRARPRWPRFSEDLPRGRRPRLALRLLHRRLRRGGRSTERCAQTIVFSDHSLATDSVFAEVQLVSCRNVLIYFDRELQDRAVGAVPRFAVPPRLSRPGRARRRCASRSHAAAFEPICPRGADLPAGDDATSARDADPALRAGRRHRRLRRRRSRRSSAAAGAAAAASRCRSSWCCTCRGAAAALLAEVLAPRARLPVREPVDKEPLEPARVYVAPPDYHLLVERGPAVRAVGGRAGQLLAAVDRRAVRVGRRRLRARLIGDRALGRQRGRRATGFAASARPVVSASSSAPAEASSPEMPRAAREACPEALERTAAGIRELLLAVLPPAAPGPRRARSEEEQCLRTDRPSCWSTTARRTCWRSPPCCSGTMPCC